MVLQHNLAAMYTNKQLGITSKAQAKSAEKLSTGYRINRAADDAAGLQISENMRRQIRGLNKASKNAEDGISYCQVADGAMGEIDSIVHRVKELCIQGANDTNTDADREAIQREIDALADEIGNITDNTEFNTLDVFGRNRECTATKVDSTTGEVLEVISSSVAPVTGNNYGLGEVLGANCVSSDIESHTMSSGTGTWNVTGKLLQADTAVYKNDKLSEIEALIGRTPTSYLDALQSQYCNQTSGNPLTFSVGSTQITLQYKEVITNSPFGPGYVLESATCTDASGKTTDYGTLVASKGDAPVYDTEYNSSWLDFQNVGTAPLVSDLYNQGFSIGSAGDSGYCSIMFTNGSDGNYQNIANPVTSYSYSAGNSKLLKIDISDLPNTSPDAGEAIVQRIMAAVKETGLDSSYTQFAHDTAASPDAKLYILDNRGSDSKSGTFELISRGTNGEQVSQDKTTHTIDNGDGTHTVYTYEDRDLWIQSGDLELSGIMMEKEWLTRTNIGLDRVVVNSFENASASIVVCDHALEKVSSARSNMGAYMNRLEHAVAVDDNTSENVQSSESRLRDTNMADEMVAYSKSNILAQAGQSMLAQANQSTQGILSLLQ